MLFVTATLRCVYKMCNVVISFWVVFVSKQWFRKLHKVSNEITNGYKSTVAWIKRYRTTEPWIPKVLAFAPEMQLNNIYGSIICRNVSEIMVSIETIVLKLKKIQFFTSIG